MSSTNLTFKVGGVHMNEHKELSEAVSIERLPEPKIVYIPMSQHIGAPCKPTVQKGDEVKVGQTIGSSEAFISADIHSSVSGVVTKIETMYTADGRFCECVVIENDGLNTTVDFQPIPNYDELKVEDFVPFAKKMGLVGMGGAGFPLHAKLKGENPPLDECIINGAECEPFLTCDHRIMLEKTSEILEGLKIFSNFYNKEVSYMAIEENKPDAIKKMEEVINSNSRFSNLKVVSCQTKYPQGDSKRLSEAVLGRIVPQNGVTNDVGVFLTNVGTTLAFYEAVVEGRPSYERVMTVSGKGIQQPKNLLVKIGTPVEDIINYCGGLKEDAIEIVCGGPMTGKSVFDLKSPITKTTSGLLALTQEEMNYAEESPCIRCSRCVDHCPANINPTDINAAILMNDVDFCNELHADQCMECGICSFVCPAKRNLAPSVKLAKREIKLRAIK
ncbi:electron transport complex protein RnfC [Peptoniphilus asaccharolyticus DSM 20463]|uniref:Ion-translocating oxidoreductase complex subunit C n=1 Tax=Peptoniphilus asaccharolyticus DSM 20463 TaxID=573058 RepID=A0A1W1UMA8_PEPAS|nr:electron transport complex subunit RsxC [Peptoniphilus asaccharolyticus]MBL7574918.1 electron transport complex subunit RsxC [Peptoniphilus asaccharolyticus]SMB82275.1 electron transport complex protein RnfC [Peptoniphilus asaccharolyticus DSM 20463]